MTPSTAHRRPLTGSLALFLAAVRLLLAPLQISSGSFDPSTLPPADALHELPGRRFFTQNTGQYPDQIRFVGEASWGRFAIAGDGLWLIASRGQVGHAVRLRFVGAKPRAANVPISPAAGRIQLLKSMHAPPRSQAAWRYRSVMIRELYSGVDLEIYLYGGPAWRATIRRGMTAQALEDIAIRIDGANGVSVDGDTLRIATDVGELLLPLIEVSSAAGTQSPLVTEDTEGYTVRCPFSPGPPVADHSGVSLDHGLIYSTFVGDSEEDRFWDLAVDAAGFTYLVGHTESPGFPTTPGPFRVPRGERDVIVTKMSPEGQLVFSAIFGGSDDDTGLCIAIDSAGAAYIAGKTGSADLPVTPAAHDRDLSGNWDGFVAKLAPDGMSLAYSTFLGGSGEEEVKGIALDSGGNAYVTGWTLSGDFPTTPNSFNPARGDSKDAFVAKLDSNGSSILYSGFVGGLLDEEGHAIAVGGSGSAYVVGWTKSEDFAASPGAFQSAYSGYDDAFVASIAPDGRSLIYSTLLGGAGKDRAHDVQVDALANAYVAGETKSADFPCTAGAFSGELAGREDAFVARIAPDGQSLGYSTLIGGSSTDVGNGIAIDERGVAYVAGNTLSNDLPVTADAFDRTFNWNLGTFWKLDAFAASLSPDGSQVRYCSYLGGTGEDQAQSIGLGTQSVINLAGFTVSSGFPTAAAFDGTLGGSWDAFVSSLRISRPPPSPTSTPSRTPSPTPSATPISAPTRTTLPDLVISSLGIELEVGDGCLAAPSAPLGVRAIVTNMGDADAGQFEIEVNGVRATIAGGLAAGADAERWFGGYRWPSPELAIVDALDEIAERNEDNNRLNVLLPIPTPPVTCTPSPSTTPTVRPPRPISLPLVLKAQ